MGRRGIRLIQRRFPGLIISGSWFHDLGLSPAFGLIFRFNLSINNHSQQVSRVPLDSPVRRRFSSSLASAGKDSISKDGHPIQDGYGLGDRSFNRSSGESC